MFAFAGLWEGWRDPNGQWLKTCTILTTTPNAVTSTVHDRMPVILDPADYDPWLNPGMKDTAAISQLLKPFEAQLMRACPVSSRVNQVQNNDLECCRKSRAGCAAAKPVIWMTAGCLHELYPPP